MSACGGCGGFMEWPRQCGYCKGWFCDSCSSAYCHDCPDYDSEPDDFEEQDSEE